MGEVVKVIGTVDSVPVILEHKEGNIWQVPVPSDQDGEYIVEIIAEDDAGNRAYLARILYTVDAGNICIHMLPLPRFLFDCQPAGYQFQRVIPVCKGVSL